jgi:hypothetical protein
MTAALVLSELRAHGATAYRHGDRVRIVPAAALSPDLLERVRAHKAVLLAALPEAPPDVPALPASEAIDPEVSWRLAVMLPQVPPVGSVPLLVARDGAWPTEEHCSTCGDALEEGSRCAPCATAAAIALKRGRPRLTS